jgi:hypothetical protein
MVALLVASSSAAMAIPQFSALTGNRCVNCHVSPTGGGLRNELGWYSYYDVSMVPRKSSLISWAYPEDESNQFFDGLLTVGMDVRVQNTRSFLEGSSRSTFPMQASLYAAITPVKAVTVEGSFNLAALRITDVTRSRYPGQRIGSASVLFQPDASLPTIRAGLFRPSIGMRYDDHTMAPYSWANTTLRQTYLAPDWSEFGAEINYESLKWLSVQAGVFGSEALSRLRVSNGQDQQSVIQGNSPTLTARAVVWPRAFNDMLNMWFGGSMLINNEFRMTSAFAGIGLSDHLSLMLDYTTTELDDAIRSSNFMAELGYQAYSPLYVYARYERYTTDQELAPGNIIANAAVFGAQIFVLPYVELRPEYRLWDTWKQGTANRWNLQLHLFY